jgi:hypothetical protein
MDWAFLAMQLYIHPCLGRSLDFRCSFDVTGVHPQNVQLHNVQLQNVQLLNVNLPNVQLHNVQVTNVQITKRLVYTLNEHIPLYLFTQGRGGGGEPVRRLEGR